MINMFKYLLIVVLSIATTGVTLSQPVSPFSTGMNPSASQAKGDPKAGIPFEQPGTKKKPLVVEILEGETDSAEKLVARDHRLLEATNSQWTMKLTAGLVFLAFVQAILFLWQLSLMNKSTHLGRAGERAYLFVESVSQNSQEWSSGIAPFKWTFRVTNHGRTPAIITEIAAYSTISDGTPTENGWNDIGALYPSNNQGRLAIEKLPPSYVIGREASSLDFFRHGDRSQLVVNSSVRDEIKNRNVDLFMRICGPGTYFWLVGHVKYLDSYGVACISKFCFGVEPWVTVSERGGEKLNSRT
jgi:hypothetical protein